MPRVYDEDCGYALIVDDGESYAEARQAYRALLDALGER